MTATYRDDPRWQESQARYLSSCDKSTGTSDERTVRALAAALAMYEVEAEVAR